MPPQPACALDHQVDGREVDHHGIHVIIKGLLQNLRADDQALTLNSLALTAKRILNFPLLIEPVTHSETRV